MHVDILSDFILLFDVLINRFFKNLFPLSFCFVAQRELYVCSHRMSTSGLLPFSWGETGHNFMYCLRQKPSFLWPMWCSKSEAFDSLQWLSENKHPTQDWSVEWKLLTLCLRTGWVTCLYCTVCCFVWTLRTSVSRVFPPRRLSHSLSKSPDRAQHLLCGGLDTCPFCRVVKQIISVWEGSLIFLSPEEKAWLSREGQGAFS